MGQLPDLRKELERLKPQLFSYALRLTQNKDKASDLTHDTILKALEKEDLFKYQQINGAMAWLSTIMQNTFRDQRQSLKYKTDIKSVEITEYRDIKDNTPDQESRLRAVDLLHAFSKVRYRWRLMMILFGAYGYTLDEIASILKIKVGTVKSGLSRGRAIMAKHYGEEQYSRLRIVNKAKWEDPVYREKQRISREKRKLRSKDEIPSGN